MHFRPVKNVTHNVCCMLLQGLNVDMTGVGLQQCAGINDSYYGFESDLLWGADWGRKDFMRSLYKVSRNTPSIMQHTGHPHIC